MSDTLEWLNKRLIAVRYQTIAEAVKGNNYPLPQKLASIMPPSGTAADYLHALGEYGIWSEAIKFLAYIIHPRVGIWWGYRTIVAMGEDFMDAKERADKDALMIAGAETQEGNADASGKTSAAAATLKADAKKMSAAAENANEPLDDKLAATDAMSDAEIAQKTEDTFKQIFNAYDEVKKRLSPEIMHKIYNASPAINKVLADKLGMSPQQYYEKLFAQMEETRAQVPDLVNGLKSSGGDATTQAELAAAIAKTRQELDAKMPSELKKASQSQTVPPLSAHLQMRKVLDAIYAWILNPNAENSLKANELGDNSDGIAPSFVASAAYYAFGMVPDPKSADVVPFPPGVASEALNDALSKILEDFPQGAESTRSHSECYQYVLKIGLECARSADNWTNIADNETPPHDVLHRRIEQAFHIDTGTPPDAAALFAKKFHRMGPEAEAGDKRPSLYKRPDNLPRGAAASTVKSTDASTAARKYQRWVPPPPAWM